MRPSCAICFLIVVVCIISSGAKKKDSTTNRNPPQKDGVKNKENLKKPVKKGNPNVKKEDTEEDEDGETEEESSSEEDSEEDADVDEEEGDEERTDNDSFTPISSEEFKGDFREEIQEKGIFYSMKDIKKFFSGPDFHGASEIDKMFKRHNESDYLVLEKKAANLGKPMMPFYVVEGTNPDIRRKVAQILAQRLKGLYILNQPRVSVGPVLKESEAKRAYYSFSKYSLANKLKLLLFSKPVVTESYWMDHASYIMAKVWKKANKLPKPGAEVYQFPEDLLVPNVTFVILNTAPPRIGRPPSKAYLFEQRVMLVYKRFKGAKVHIIRFSESAKEIVDKIDIYLNPDQKFKKRNEFHIEVVDKLKEPEK